MANQNVAGEGVVCSAAGAQHEIQSRQRVQATGVLGCSRMVARHEDVGAGQVEGEYIYPFTQVFRVMVLPGAVWFVGAAWFVGAHWWSGARRSAPCRQIVDPTAVSPGAPERQKQRDRGGREAKIEADRRCLVQIDVGWCMLTAGWCMLTLVGAC